MFRSLLICLLLFTCSVHAAGELEALKTAAEQGYAGAQYNLGFVYDRGEGVPEDHVQAYAWFSVAAAQSDEVSRDAKEFIVKDMASAEIAEAQKLSREYWESYVSNAEK